MADNDPTDPTPFVALAAKILRDRGEKPVFAGMNPVVRRYLVEARRGYYRTPEEVNQALLDMKDEMLYEYFPEEFAQIEAARAAEPSGVNQAAEMALRKKQNTVDMPKDYRNGGRVRLV